MTETGILKIYCLHYFVIFTWGWAPLFLLPSPLTHAHPCRMNDSNECTIFFNYMCVLCVSKLINLFASFFLQICSSAVSGKKKKISHSSGDNISELIVIASRDCITVLSQALIILMGECYFIFLLVVIFGNSVFPVIDLKPSENSGIRFFFRQFQAVEDLSFSRTNLEMTTWTNSSEGKPVARHAWNWPSHKWCRLLVVNETVWLFPVDVLVSKVELVWRRFHRFWDIRDFTLSRTSYFLLQIYL